MHERMTLCNMATELGAMTGIVAPDATTAAFRRGRRRSGRSVPNGRATTTPLSRDDRFDAAPWRRRSRCRTARPMPAGRRSSRRADRSCLYRELHRRQAHRSAHGGAGAERSRGRQGRAADGRAGLAARDRNRRRGRNAGDAARCRRHHDAERLRRLRRLRPRRAGGERGCISSTARNSKGRMGARTAQVFLASPYTVAAAAVAGEISDPREFLSERADPKQRQSLGVRRQHRHRSAGAGHLHETADRGDRAPLPGGRRPALRRRSRAAMWWSAAAISAWAPRASRRRRRCANWAWARCWRSRSAASSIAMRSISACWRWSAPNRQNRRRRPHCARTGGRQGA